MSQRISRKSVESLATRLCDIVSEREANIKATMENLAVVEELSAKLGVLRDVAMRGKNQVLVEQSEILDMKSRLDEIAGMPEINTDDPRCDADVLSFVEGESIVSGAERLRYMDSLSALNENIRLALDEIGQFLKQHALKEPVVGGEEHLYVSPFSAEEEAKTDKRAQVPASGITVLTTDGKLVPMNSLNMKLIKPGELARAKKLCKMCGEHTANALIFKCQCVLCKTCLERQLLAGGGKILFNVFEATGARKQAAMCVCPLHGWPMNMGTVCKLLGPDKLEQASVEALKRQLKLCISRK